MVVVGVLNLFGPLVGMVLTDDGVLAPFDPPAPLPVPQLQSQLHFGVVDAEAGVVA